VRCDLTLCLLVLALTFPGRNRFKDGLLTAAVDVVTSWLSLMAILALCAYATSSFGVFDRQVLLWWAVLTPLAQSTAVWAGHAMDDGQVVKQATKGDPRITPFGAFRCLSAPHLAGRSAAVHQCAARTHEHRRATYACGGAR
jgi:hypothetical protein